MRHDSFSNHGIDDAGAEVMVKALVEFGSKPSHGLHGFWPPVLRHDPSCESGCLLISDASAGLKRDPAIVQATGMAVGLAPLAFNAHGAQTASGSGRRGRRIGLVALYVCYR